MQLIKLAEKQKEAVAEEYSKYKIWNWIRLWDKMELPQLHDFPRNSDQTQIMNDI